MKVETRRLEFGLPYGRMFRPIIVDATGRNFYACSYRMDRLLVAMRDEMRRIRKRRGRLRK